jgi:hypothetical protein
MPKDEQHEEEKRKRMLAQGAGSESQPVRLVTREEPWPPLILKGARFRYTPGTPTGSFAQTRWAALAAQTPAQAGTSRHTRSAP